MSDSSKLEKTLFEFLLIHFRFTYYRKQQSKLVNWISQQFFADYEKKQKGFFLTKAKNKKLLIVNCSAPTKCFFGKKNYKVNYWLKMPKIMTIVQFISLLLLIIFIFFSSYLWYSERLIQLCFALIICAVLSVIAIGLPQFKCFSHIATLTTAIMIAQNSQMDLLLLKGEMSDLPHKLIANKYSKIVWLRDIYNGEQIYLAGRKVDNTKEEMIFAADKTPEKEILVKNVNRYGNEVVPKSFIISLTKLEQLASEITINHILKI